MNTPDHIPVLLDEVLAAIDSAPEGGVVDATFGAGGYSTAILESTNRTVFAIDRDPTTQQFGDALYAKFGSRFHLSMGCFSRMSAIVAQITDLPIAAIVMDIGVSSMQLDHAERGFSFMRDGDLDMRMSDGGASAADLIAHLSADQLADVFFHFGEERAARRVARAIVEARKAAQITTTLQLANIVRAAVPGKPGKIDKATRTFQGLRLAVNSELSELCAGLVGASQLLAPDGVLACVSFHSLEDRIVKHFMRYADIKGNFQQLRPAHSLPDDIKIGRLGVQIGFSPIGDDHGTKFASYSPMYLLNKRPIKSCNAEIARNPRSRSARLRIAYRAPMAVTS